MADARVLPAGFARVSGPSSNPARALAGLTAACVVYALFAGFRDLLAFSTFAVWIFYAATAVALIRLRRRRVGEPLAWRAPGGWLPPAVVLVTAALMTTGIVAADWRHAAVGALLLAAGIPAWWLTQRARRRAGRESG